MMTKRSMNVQRISASRLFQSRLIIASLSLAIIASCSNGLAHKDSPPEKPTGPAAAVQTTSHQGVGVVKALDPKLPSIEIDHEEIKGLMPAMQMDFHVKDKSLLNDLAVGDHIEFTVENGVGGLMITAIRKIGS
jgi:Cu/Ag efflux protein CusF